MDFVPFVPGSGADFSPSQAGYSNQGAFRFWCQKVLPLVYDDSLSYYELLCKVVDYLNHTIEDVATIESNLAHVVESYNELQGYVNTSYGNLVDYVNQTYGDLTSFVNTYFDNLDVQNEVNTKLDEMALDGSLSLLLAPLIPDLVTDWLSEHITPTTPIVDDTLTITGAAADAKVTGDKINELDEELSEIDNTPISNAYMVDNINFLDKNKITLNKYCNTNNPITFADSTEYNVVIVDVEENTEYCFIRGDNYINASVVNSRYRFVVFSDDSLTGVGSVISTSGSIFTVPVGATKAIITYDKTYDANQIMLIKGDTDKGFIKYTPYHALYKKARVNIEDVNDLTNNGLNLCNENNSVVGTVAPTGAITDNSSYYTTEYIPVKANTTYYISPEARIIVLFDANYKLITFDNSSAHAVSFTTTVDGYARISYYAVDYGKIIISTSNNYYGYRENHIQFKENIFLNENQIINSFNGNILYRKKWAVCGDSFTYGSESAPLTDGIYKGKNTVYPYIIGNRNDMEIISFFNGGRTLAYPQDGTFSNSLTNPSADFYYQNIPVDVDYITIYLGINDSSHREGSSPDGEDVTGVIPLGTISDETTATYYGAWNVVLSWLIQNRPFAHIGIIATNGAATADYRTACIEIARKYGIPYLDLNGDDRTPAMIRSKNPNISETVKNIINNKQAVDWTGERTGTVNKHPNDNAHKYESYFIENFLRSI